MKKFKVSGFTEEEMELLKELRFPIGELNHTKVVQKRTKRFLANGGYANKQVITRDDIRYFVVPKMIADKELQYQKSIPKDAKDKSTIQEYFYLKDLEKEAISITRQFCKPRPTKSMESPKAEVEVVETVEEVKGLSNTMKGKVKKMVEDQKDADEIAESLGVDKARVIDYLKKLNK